MAYLEDYREEDRQPGQQSSGPGTSYAPSGGAPAPKASSGMTPAPIADYFTANRDAASGMAGDMGNRVESAGREAVQAWDAGKAQDAWARAENLGTQEGFASELHDAYQDPGYTQGMGALDAYVATRASAPGQFDALRARFSALDPNVVGSPSPEAPTMRNVGAQPLPEGYRPLAPGESGGEYVLHHADDRYYSGSPSDGTTESTLKVHAQAPYESEYDAYADWQAKNNAWEKQYKDAQAEYDAANKQYGEDMDAYNQKRQPFLEAFGL